MVVSAHYPLAAPPQKAYLPTLYLQEVAPSILKVPRGGSGRVHGTSYSVCTEQSRAACFWIRLLSVSVSFVCCVAEEVMVGWLPKGEGDHSLSVKVLIL